MRKEWTSWSPFPDPNSKEYLHAPFGPGGYHLRRKDRKEYILYGHSKSVAHRMSSLLPRPLGTGGRSNEEKRQCVLEHVKNIEYRTFACNTVQEARVEEKELQLNHLHKFDI